MLIMQLDFPAHKGKTRIESISPTSPKFEDMHFQRKNGRERMNTVIADVARSTMKRARRGLFGNTGKLFGNNVSHSERKCASISY